jgi:hypothetical protein
LEEVEAWRGVVTATDALVSALENYGPQERADGSGQEVEKAWRVKARNAVRSIMSKARDVWEGTEEWELLQQRLEELKGSGS